MNHAYIDPLVWAERVGEIVGSGEKRKYYRFQPVILNCRVYRQVKICR